MPGIKNVLKRFSVILCISLLTLLSGCSKLNITADDFLSPPRASGEMYEIEQTLKANVSGAYTLKYPTAGEYRSAYILTDLTGTGTKSFALAFYSTINDENSTFMHLKLMKKVGDEWISVSDITVNAVGVEKVEISDLNGDGVKEITVGWNVYAGMDKMVTAYILDGKKLVPLMQESYTNFMCCDFMGDGREELFLIYHNSSTAKAYARYFTFEGNDIIKAGSCEIDGTVTSFNEPVLSTLSNGIPAVYIDAVKGTGMQTEIVYVKKGNLVAPLYKKGSKNLAEHPTYRNTNVASKDINSDGCLDIPIVQNYDNLTINQDASLLNPITKWSSYNGTTFKVSLQAVMNYTDGYYIELPNNWVGCTTVAMEIENRLRTVYLWDTETGKVKSELVKIRAVSETVWDKPDNGFNDYEEITRQEGVVYVAMFSGYRGAEKINLEGLKKIFHIIG